MMGGVEFYYFQTRDYVVFPADNNVNMSPVDRAVRAGDYYGYLDYDYTQVWYQSNKLKFFFSGNFKSLSTFIRRQSSRGWRNSGAGTSYLSPCPRPPGVSWVSWLSRRYFISSRIYCLDMW